MLVFNLRVWVCALCAAIRGGASLLRKLALVVLCCCYGTAALAEHGTVLQNFADTFDAATVFPGADRLGDPGIAGALLRHPEPPVSPQVHRVALHRTGDCRSRNLRRVLAPLRCCRRRPDHRPGRIVRELS